MKDILVLPTLKSITKEMLSDRKLSAVAAPDVYPGLQAVEAKKMLHISELCSKQWEKAKIVMPEKYGTTVIPMLLGSGISKTRLRLYGNNDSRNVNSAESYQTQGRIAQYNNIYAGRRAFIIGNGPSLTVSDLNCLRNEITFASNKIYLAFEQTDWRPTYYTVCDYLVACNNLDKINNLEILKIFPSSLQKHGCTGYGTVWYDERFENRFFKEWDDDLRKKGTFLFSGDARYGIQGGYTVIYHQLQLAYYMGIREIILIGVDFHFTIPEIKSIESKFTSGVYREALLSNGEKNHFHADYRKPGETWSIPQLDLQEHAFLAARNIYQKAGGRLINASRKSALAVLDKCSFEQILEER